MFPEVAIGSQVTTEYDLVMLWVGVLPSYQGECDSSAFYHIHNIATLISHYGLVDILAFPTHTASHDNVTVVITNMIQIHFHNETLYCSKLFEF